MLVKIQTSGLCHTDIHAAHGDWPVQPKMPLIPGHEGVGIIEALGEGVDHLAVGDRVALPWLGHACGRCRYCIGGLGYLGLQYGKVLGGRTIAVDVEDSKLALAEKLGADHVVDARGDQAAQVAAIGGADVALVTVPSPRAMAAAYASLNPMGRLVLVGLPADNQLTLPVFETVLTGIRVQGSLVGTRNDLAECFALHAAGRTTVVAEGRALEDVNECFEEVLAGRVPARLVFEIS